MCALGVVLSQAHSPEPHNLINPIDRPFDDLLHIPVHTDKLTRTHTMMRLSSTTTATVAFFIALLAILQCTAASFQCKQRINWAPGYPKVKHFKQYGCRSCSQSKIFSARVAYDYYMTADIDFAVDDSPPRARYRSKKLAQLASNKILEYKTNERSMTCKTDFVGGLWHCMRFTYSMTTYSGYADVKRWRGPFKCRTKREWISISGHTRQAAKWCDLQRTKMC